MPSGPGSFGVPHLRLACDRTIRPSGARFRVRSRDQTGQDRMRSDSTTRMPQPRPDVLTFDSVARQNGRVDKIRLENADPDAGDSGRRVPRFRAPCRSCSGPPRSIPRLLDVSDPPGILPFDQRRQRWGARFAAGAHGRSLRFHGPGFAVDFSQAPPWPKRDDLFAAPNVIAGETRWRPPELCDARPRDFSE